MGETKESTQTLSQQQHQEPQGELERTELHIRSRRNALWNIFEGLEAGLVDKLAGLSLESVQQALLDSNPEAASECLAQLSSSTGLESSPAPSSESGCQEHARIQRSFSAATGEELQQILQMSRQRRNAVGNLFDLLSPSQKLLLAEHLQEQVERLQHGFQTSDDVSSDSTQLILALADVASTSLSSSSSSSTGSGSSVSSPRSQGEIVCR